MFYATAFVMGMELLLALYEVIAPIIEKLMGELNAADHLRY